MGSASIEKTKSGQVADDSTFSATLPENEIEFKLSKVQDAPPAPGQYPDERNAEADDASLVATGADAFAKAKEVIEMEANYEDKSRAVPKVIRRGVS